MDQYWNLIIICSVPDTTTVDNLVHLYAQCTVGSVISAGAVIDLRIYRGLIS